MKQSETIRFSVPAARPRRHSMLFDRDLPFRGRRERDRTEYQRRPKHRYQDRDTV